MWAEWARSSFYPALSRIFHQLVRTREGERDMTEVAAGAEALIALLPRLDARLGDGPWLCGERPCFADVMIGSLLYRYMTLDFVKGPTPAIDAWYARLTGRPAYAEHVMVSYESLRPS
jgi:glutathione S-transferase